MAGRQKQPIDLILLNGKSHKTRKEIDERRKSEVVAPSGNIKAPNYLTKEQAKHFKKLAAQLKAINILANIDAEALARYVVAEEVFELLTKKIQDNEIQEDIFEFEKTANLHDKYCKLCRSLASDLGLNITSRCKLVVPKVEKEKPINRFADFEKVSNGDERQNN